MGRKASSLKLLRHRSEALQAARDVVPRRPLADEDCDLGLELRLIIERAGIDIDQPRHHLGRAIDHAQAGRTGEAACRLAAAAHPGEDPLLAFDGHGVLGEAEPADMARAAGTLAAAAVAEPLDDGLALGPIAERPAGASTFDHQATMTRPAAGANGAT